MNMKTHDDCMLSARTQNQKGQMAVETILLMVITVGLMAMAMKFFKGNGNGPIVSQLTQGPWARLSGMIQCGVWEPCGFGNPNPGKNPNTMARTLTLDPKAMPK